MGLAKSNLSALKIDVEPKRLLVTSEPYVVYTTRGFQPAVNVLERRSKREYFIYIAAKSLADRLRELQGENRDSFVGLEFWLRKESAERTSKYVLEE